MYDFPLSMKAHYKVVVEEGTNITQVFYIPKNIILLYFSSAMTVKATITNYP